MSTSTRIIPNQSVILTTFVNSHHDAIAFDIFENPYFQASQIRLIKQILLIQLNLKVRISKSVKNSQII